MALTLEQRQYYDNLNEMFATHGWKDLVEEAAKEVYQLQADALEQAKSVEDLYFLKGRAYQLTVLTQLEEISDYMKAQLEAEPEDDVLDTDF